ncbi:MAG: cytidine deaminase [Bacteroidales bacterium]
MKSIKIETNIAIYTYSELSETEKRVVTAAQEATCRAYAPYSEFHVGAALLLSNGEIICGNNQENGAYPSGMCAERVAINYAKSIHPELSIEMIAIVASQNGEGFTKEMVSPCGGCRQVLTETEMRQSSPIRVLMVGENGIWVVDSGSYLMPLSFSLDR